MSHVMMQFSLVGFQIQIADICMIVFTGRIIIFLLICIIALKLLSLHTHTYIYTYIQGVS